MSLTSPLFCDNCGAANRTQAQFCRACGQALHLQDVLASTLTLTGLLAPRIMLKQRYSILGPAGRGGFGAVYKAMDEQFGNRLVAIKEMSQSSLSPQELAEASAAFKHEALLLAGLNHPNLPHIYEQFSENGRSYLVMDFIEGETLEVLLQRLGSAKMPLEKVLDIALQLCSVLEYLHTRQPPIIFRDLKPGNVMVMPTGNVYLIDFGIARLFKPGQEKDTTALGSYGYAPPEQYGKSQTTMRADIYSLGATMHQLLTGEDPSETPFQFSPVQLFDPALTTLESLVMRMVSVSVDKRPASIALVRQELQQITSAYTLGRTLPHTTSAANNAPPVTLPPLPVQLNGAAIQTTKPSSSTTAKRAPRRSGPAQIYPQANMLYVCLGHSSRITSLAWSPDGKYLASASYDKSVQLWEADSGKHLVTYKGHSGRVNAVAWSPDSKLIASASDDQTVRIWQPLSTRTEYIFDKHTGPVHTVAWSPDGQSIASGDEGTQVLVWDAVSDAHEISITYSEHSNVVLTVAWSPDGQSIASAGKDRVVRIWEPDKLRQKRSLLSTLLFRNYGQKNWNSFGSQIPAVVWSPDSHRLAAVCSDYHVRIRSVHTGNLSLSLGIDNGTLKNTIAWSPSGQHLAIGGNDKLVRLWNVSARKETYIYSGHSGYVVSVAWSPDGSRIASAGVDRTIQVWQAR